jgi:hypothetical protein
LNIHQKTNKIVIRLTLTVQLLYGIIKHALAGVLIAAVISFFLYVLGDESFRHYMRPALIWVLAIIYFIDLLALIIQFAFYSSNAKRLGVSFEKLYELKISKAFSVKEIKEMSKEQFEVHRRLARVVLEQSQKNK